MKPVVAICWGLVLAVPVAGLGQVLGPDPETLGFDDPESWALKYFSSVIMPSPMGGPDTLEPWQLEWRLEVGEVPFLSETQRRVGFDGTKVEDLNHVQLLLRPALAIGLPGGFYTEFSYLPPVTYFGVDSELLSVMAGREMFTLGGISAGLHLFASYGASEGAFTCSEDLIAGGHDPFDCTPPSRDRSRMRVYGATLSLKAQTDAFGGWVPFAEITYREMNLDFRTRVTVFDDSAVDSRTLTTRGNNWSYLAGVQVDVGDRWELILAFNYAPLDVVRDARRGVENDSLRQVRSQIRFRF
ncbi:MAG: hypothetical protein ACFE0O_01860 [Opitutales bacterium]